MLTKPKKSFLNDITWERFGQLSAIGLAFFLPISTSLTTIFALATLFAWVCGGDYSQKKQFLTHPLVKWIYPLIFLTFFGVIYSVGDKHSIINALVDSLRLALIPVLLYFFVQQKTANKALWAFTAAMLLTLGLAFLKVYGGFPIGLKYTTGAVFKSHIKTSFFMAIACFFLTYQFQRFSQYRYLFILVILLMVHYLLFMSVGRIGYLTLISCLFITAWQYQGLKGILWALLASVILLLSAYFASDLFSSRINLLAQDIDFYRQGGRLIESSLGSRLEFAHTSLKLIFQKPFLGWGTGSFGTVYEQIHAGENTLFTDNPHNEYLRIGVELGLLGLVCLLFLFYHYWRLSRQLPDHIRGFCQGVLLTFMLGCCLNSWLKDFAEGYFFSLMSAICFAYLPLPKKEKWVKGVLH